MSMLRMDDGLLNNKSSFVPGQSIHQILEQLESEIDLGLELPETPVVPQLHRNPSISPPFKQISLCSSPHFAGASNRNSLEFISNQPVRRDSGVFSEATPVLHHERSSKRYRFSVDGASLEALSDNRAVSDRRTPAWRHSSAPLSGPFNAEPSFPPRNNGFPRRSRVVYHGRRFSGLVRSKPAQESCLKASKDPVESRQPDLVRNDDDFQPSPTRVTRHILPRLVIPDNARHQAIPPPDKFSEGSPSTPVLERSNVLPRIPSPRINRNYGTVRVSDISAPLKEESSHGNTNLSSEHESSHVLKGHSDIDHYPQSSSSTINPLHFQPPHSPDNNSHIEESDKGHTTLGSAEESKMFKSVMQILRRSDSQRGPRRKPSKKTRKQEPELSASPEAVSPIAESSSPISSTQTPVSSTTSYSPTESGNPPPEYPSAMQPCAVCSDLFDANAIPRAPESRCCHAQTICRDCSLQWIQTRLRDHGAAAIRCPSPQCSENLSFHDVQTLGCAKTLEA